MPPSVAGLGTLTGVRRQCKNPLKNRYESERTNSGSRPASRKAGKTSFGLAEKDLIERSREQPESKIVPG
jgi:hypothetical protein